MNDHHCPPGGPWASDSELQISVHGGEPPGPPYCAASGIGATALRQGGCLCLQTSVRADSAIKAAVSAAFAAASEASIAAFADFVASSTNLSTCLASSAISSYKFEENNDNTSTWQGPTARAIALIALKTSLPTADAAHPAALAATAASSAACAVAAARSAACDATNTTWRISARCSGFASSAIFAVNEAARSAAKADRFAETLPKKPLPADPTIPSVHGRRNLISVEFNPHTPLVVNEHILPILQTFGASLCRRQLKIFIISASNDSAESTR